MFLEQGSVPASDSGWIEVISGPMFSGKTEELIRRLRRALIAGQQVGIFKPSVDTRYSPDEVVSHDARSLPSIAVHKAAEILEKGKDFRVVGIDEAQFFDEDLVEVVNEMADRGQRIVVAGLDLDHLGRPFGPMPHLMATAEFVTKVHAICARTGGLAHYSLRKDPDGGLIQLGHGDAYEPVSRSVFSKMRRKR